MTPVYYFGCVGEPGHYLWLPGPKRVWGDSQPIPRVLQEFNGRIDGMFAPTGIAQKQGPVAMHVVHGWTVMAFWDRTVDKRANSNSAFFAKASPGFHYTFNEMRAFADAAFPEVWKRITSAIELEEYVR